MGHQGVAITVDNQAGQSVGFRVHEAHRRVLVARGTIGGRREVRAGAELAVGPGDDHHPVPAGVLTFFGNSGAQAIAMSRFGEHELSEAGLDPVYIPLTVDTSTFTRTDSIESEGITENVKVWRTDVPARIADALGLEKVMFEAADPEVFGWYIKKMPC